MIRFRWSGSKFETPTDVARPSPPCAENSVSVRQVDSKSPSYLVGSGQWMRNRSTRSSPSFRSDSSNARRASSARWKPLLSLVVT